MEWRELNEGGGKESTRKGRGFVWGNGPRACDKTNVNQISHRLIYLCIEI